METKASSCKRSAVESAGFQSNEESHSCLVIVSEIQLSHSALRGKASSSELSRNSFELKGLWVGAGVYHYHTPPPKSAEQLCAPARRGLRRCVGLGSVSGTAPPQGKLLMTDTCSGPGLHHGVTKLHYPNETPGKEWPPASPHLFSWDPKEKDLMSQTSSLPTRLGAGTGD